MAKDAKEIKVKRTHTFSPTQLLAVEELARQERRSVSGQLEIIIELGLKAVRAQQSRMAPTENEPGNRRPARAAAA